MPLHTGYTAEELDEKVKDLLLIGQNGAAHWPAARRLSYINEAQAWVQLRILRHVAERKTSFFTFSMDGSSFEVTLPDDCLVEVRLFKRNTAKTGDAQWEAIRFIRPKHEDGWRPDSGEEVWVANGRTLRAKTLAEPEGDYRLQYVQRVPDLVADEDVCQIDPEFQEGVWTRAAQRCAIAANDAPLADRLAADLKDWIQQVEDKAKFLDSMRSGEVTPRPATDFHDGSLFRLSERLRARFGPAMPADMLSPDRIRLALNAAQERIALKVKKVFGSHLEKYHHFTMDGSASTDVMLPKDFKSLVLLEQQCSSAAGEAGWVEVPVIRPTDRDRFICPQVATVPTGVTTCPFVLSGQKLRPMSSGAVTGSFRMLYIPRIAPMTADTDECNLDGDYHQAVIADAARDLAIAFGQMDLAAVFLGEVADWEAAIIVDARTRNYRNHETIQDEMGWSADGDGDSYALGWR